MKNHDDDETHFLDKSACRRGGFADLHMRHGRERGAAESAAPVSKLMKADIGVEAALVARCGYGLD